MPQLLTISQAAAALSLKPSTLRDWMLKRRLPVVHCGRAVRIPSEAIERYIQSRTTPARELRVPGNAAAANAPLDNPDQSEVWQIAEGALRVVQTVYVLSFELPPSSTARKPGRGPVSGYSTPGIAEGAMANPPNRPPGYQEFPKMVYGLDGSNKTVQNQEEQEALGSSWFERPDKAFAAFDSLPPATQLSVLLRSKSPKAVDATYQRRFLSTQGLEQWRILQEYRDSFPAFAFESSWAKGYIDHLPPVRPEDVSSQAQHGGESPRAVPSADSATVSSGAVTDSAVKAVVNASDPAQVHRALEAMGRVYGTEWNREMGESALKLHSDLDAADLGRRLQVFKEHFSTRRRKLASLQERLCTDLVRLATANRGVIGAHLLDWVRAEVKGYWVSRRPGFRGWVTWGCDDAGPEGWSAPIWLLDILPEEQKFGIPTGPPSVEQATRLPESSTEAILSWISGRIEMSLFEAESRVLDRATITLASKPGPGDDPAALARQKQEVLDETRSLQSHESKGDLPDEPTSSWRRLYNEAKTDEERESLLGEFGRLHPQKAAESLWYQQRLAYHASLRLEIGDDSPVGRSAHVLAKGERCERVIREVKLIKHVYLHHCRKMTEIEEENPGLLVWEIRNSLEGEDREMFQHPRQWGPVVGYAERLLEKTEQRSRVTIQRWRKHYKRILKTRPK